MKKAQIFAVLILALGIFACQPEGRVYVNHKELSPELEWLKKDKREFNVPIDKNDILYNLSLTFRYASGYRFQVIKVKVTETSPSGKESVNEYEFKVRDDNGDYIGEPGLDIWDSEHLIESNKKYEEKGTYTYLIEQNMPNDPLNFAMEIGLVLDKAN